jgi:hypothetical protein
MYNTLYFFIIPKLRYLFNPQFHNQPKVTLTSKLTIYHRNILLQQTIKVTLRLTSTLSLL